MKRIRSIGVAPEEKTTTLAIIATLGLIIIFLGQSHARATSEAAERDLYTVCSTLNEIAPDARSEKHIAAACAHPEWFAAFEEMREKGRDAAGLR